MPEDWVSAFDFLKLATEKIGGSPDDKKRPGTRNGLEHHCNYSGFLVWMRAI